jgi:hypothetical protein
MARTLGVSLESPAAYTKQLDALSAAVHGYGVPKPVEAGTGRAALPDRDEPLTAKALVLLREAVADQDGLIVRARTMNGLRILANSKEFSESETPAIQAEWDEGIALLLKNGLISPDDSGRAFRVTAAGYRVAKAS